MSNEILDITLVSNKDIISELMNRYSYEFDVDELTDVDITNVSTDVLEDEMVLRYRDNI